MAIPVNLSACFSMRSRALSGYREGRHIPQFRHIDITAMHVGERTGDNDSVMLLDTIPVAAQAGCKAVRYVQGYRIEP